ncbi:MAG: peptidylprolyl isomerase [Brotaphodocola sp.]
MKKFRKWFLAATFALVLPIMNGCGGGIPIVSDGKMSQGYTDAQNMLIVATERNRYEAVYTDQIWQVQVDDDGNTFQNYLLSEVQKFLKELKTTNLLADEYGISLTGQEQEQLHDLADRFYESMSEEDRKYTGASCDDVYTMYEAYHRANRLIDEVTKDTNLEISDSEARVITIQEICLGDMDTAIAVHEQVTGEKADFLAIAKTMSEDPAIEKSIGRGERPASYEEEVFSLETGEISPVVESENAFYIVKCINDFDEQATLERKEKLALQRKNLAFRAVYEAFEAEHEINIGGSFWDKLTFDKEMSTTTEFFELYQEMMQKQKK